MMKKLLQIILFTVVAFVGCKSQQIQSHWTEQPIQIDGQIADWTNLPKTYFEDAGTALGISNDNEHLYLYVRLSHQWIPLLNRNGVIIWLDPSAKKKSDFGIRYFGKVPIDSISGERSPDHGKHLKSMQHISFEHMVAIDNSNKLEKTIPHNGSKGPSASMGIVDGLYSYEFSIPLSNLNNDWYAVNADPGQEISLGFEIPGIDRNELHGSRGDKGPGMGGRSGMPPGGGMGPGMGGGGRPPGMGAKRTQMQQMSEGNKLWVKTTLALPPNIQKGELSQNITIQKEN